MSGMGTLPWTMYESSEQLSRQPTRVYRKLVEKSAGSAYVMRSTVILMECHVVLGPGIRCVAKLSGCEGFNVLNNPCTQSKSLILQLVVLLLSLSCEISDANNSDKQFALRQCRLVTKKNILVKRFYDKAKN